MGIVRVLEIDIIIIALIVIFHTQISKNLNDIKKTVMNTWNFSYYHIFDNKADKKSRQKILINIVLYVMVISCIATVNGIGEYLSIAVTLLLFGCFVLFLLIEFPHGYYVIVPVVVMSMYSALQGKEMISGSIMIISGYIGISYMLVGSLLPMYSIRKINDSAILIGQLMSIVITLILNSDSFFIKKITGTDGDFIKVNTIINSTDIPQTVKEIVSNEELVDILNSFIFIKYSADFNAVFSPILNGMLVAYLISGIIINIRIIRGKKRAKEILVDIFLEEDNVVYEDLLRLSYYGGDEYVLYIMNNKKLLDLVRKHEEINVVEK